MTDAPFAVLTTTRPLRVWRTPLNTAITLSRTTFFGFDVCCRWQWRCLICRIQCTHGYFTPARAYNGACEHYKEEHDG